MKHTTDELISIAYQYFPRGMLGDEPGYDQSQELERQRTAVARARAGYRVWRSLLRKIEERFPEERFPGVSVQDLSMGLLAESNEPEDRCFAAYLWLPTREAEEHSHNLLFRVSFVVPYYSINSSAVVHTGTYYTKMELGHGALENKDSAELSADEVPFSTGIAEEIRSAFPEHEIMPAAVGNTIVPEIRVGGHFFGEATIFDALFSDHWR
jgi:hypothetical protein